MWSINRVLFCEVYRQWKLLIRLVCGQITPHSLPSLFFLLPFHFCLSPAHPYSIPSLISLPLPNKLPLLHLCILFNWSPYASSLQNLWKCVLAFTWTSIYFQSASMFFCFEAAKRLLSRMTSNDSTLLCPTPRVQVFKPATDITPCQLLNSAGAPTGRHICTHNR